MNRTDRFHFLFLFITAATVFITGCSRGPKLNEVTGRVTLDGTPQEGIVVTFEPVSGKTATGMATTGTGGAYTIYYPGDAAGIPAGEYQVRFTPAETDDGPPKWDIPEKYNRKTEVTATVKEGKNECNFDLKTR